MPFAKLKQWFRRRRHEGRLPDNQQAPRPFETSTPADREKPAPVIAKPSAKPVSNKGKPLPRKKRSKRPSAAKSSTARAAAPRPLSRQGIPILKPDEDLTVHFKDEAVDDMPRGGSPGPAGTCDPSKGTPPPASHSAQMPLPCNRAGIRLLDADTDLHDYFMTPSDEAPTVEDPSGPGPTAASDQPTRDMPADIPTDRHGIPRLDDQADLHRLFDIAHDESEDAQALGDALHRSLEHDARGLMKQKTGGFFAPRRLSLKEKLRRYPPPQAQLDLHGDTAAKARQRAETFIRRACDRGLFTVRVIVGKGLHSEIGAVLPDVIEDLIVALKRDDLILSYRWDKGIKRKSGAIVIYLATDFS